MEILKMQERLDFFKEALKRLNEILELLKKNKSNEFYDIFRDSAIKRFEFSIDLFWKSLKDILNNRYGIEGAGPKFIAKLSLENKLISQKEYEQVICMIDDRNRSSHTYDAVSAEEILSRVYDYYLLMQQISLREFEK